MENFLAIIIVVSFVMMLPLWIISVYNNLVKIQNGIEEWEGNIRVLISQIKRIREMSGKSADDASEAELTFQSNVNKEQLDSIGGTKLVALAQAYPDSVATSIRKDLVSEFNRLENEVVRALKTYNSFVTELNTQIKIFPNVLFVTLFFSGFKKAAYSENKLKKAYEDSQ
ncbi:LemA family protein [Oceanospirillaceae bacterium]|nr:LemA family protein [Oceanospirillaceae bacterium]